MSTQWHKDRLKQFWFCDRDLEAAGFNTVAEVAAAGIKQHFFLMTELRRVVFGFRQGRTYKPHLHVRPDTEARREETTKTLIADICANERRLKQ